MSMDDERTNETERTLSSEEKRNLARIKNSFERNMEGTKSTFSKSHVCFVSSGFKSSGLSHRHRIDTTDEISVPLVRMEGKKFSHQPKKWSNHGQLDVIIPLPMVFEVPEGVPEEVPEEVVGPLKDTNHVPVFNGKLDVESERVLIYDLPSAQVCFKVFDRVLTEENSDRRVVSVKLWLLWKSSERKRG